MSLETAILDLLAADSAVSGLVESRLRLEWADQGTVLPVVILTPVSNTPAFGLDLGSALYRMRVQIDGLAKTYAQARALADAIRAALHGFSGAAGDFDIDSIVFDNETALGERDGDKETRRISLDFFVTYQ